MKFYINNRLVCSIPRPLWYAFVVSIALIMLGLFGELNIFIALSSISFAFAIAFLILFARSQR